MTDFNPELLKNLYIPPSGSHKGQNGKLLLIGGSHLFHSSTLWALETASKIVDMVFYASVPENNEIVQKAKEQFHNGIVVRQADIEHYINEADVILIGPGMERTGENDLRFKIYDLREESLKEILQLEDEGEKTYYLTHYLLQKYPQKKWVIDAGALQMMEPEWLLPLNGNAILTPHHQEFDTLKLKVTQSVIPSEVEGSLANASSRTSREIPPRASLGRNDKMIEDQVREFSKQYNCTILLKGETDIVCSPNECCKVSGGNAGMTKGGTGDVLAGLVAALATKNDLFLSACAGSYINKKAGERLFEKVGYYFNSSDLVSEIPQVMKELLTSLFQYAF